MTNRFPTWAWAVDASEPSLLRALAAGAYLDRRAVVPRDGRPARRRRRADGVRVGERPGGAEPQIMVTGAPAGGTVKLVQGPVDYAGATVPDPTRSRGRFRRRTSPRGAVTTSVDTTTSTLRPDRGARRHRPRRGRLEPGVVAACAAAPGHPGRARRSPKRSPASVGSTRPPSSGDARSSSQPATGSNPPRSRNWWPPSGSILASACGSNVRPPAVGLGPNRAVVGRVHDQRWDPAVDHAGIVDVLADRGVGEQGPHRAAARSERLAREVADDRRRVATREPDRERDHGERHLREPDRGAAPDRCRERAHQAVVGSLAERERGRGEGEGLDARGVPRRPERREHAAERVPHDRDRPISGRHRGEIAEVPRPVVRDVRLVRRSEPGEVGRDHPVPVAHPVGEPLPVPA